MATLPVPAENGGAADSVVITTDATSTALVLDHVAAALERRCQQFKLATEDGDPA